MSTIDYLVNGLIFFLQIYYVVVFGRIIFSWFIRGGAEDPTLSNIYKVLYALTEPLLAPIRQIIPSIKMGMGYLDLSPLLLLILLQLLQRAISGYAV